VLTKHCLDFGRVYLEAAGLDQDHLVVDLDDILAAAPAERARLLKEHAGCDLAGGALDALRSGPLHGLTSR
jgi:hypothetical protein